MSTKKIQLALLLHRQTVLFSNLLTSLIHRQNRNQMIIYQKCDHHTDHRLNKRKRHIKYDQTLQDAFYPWEKLPDMLPESYLPA